MNADDLNEQELRSGADVETKDHVVAKLTDVVVDPITHSVTHLVVTPPGQHQQPRLVPLWLLRTANSSLQVDLDARHLKQLQRVLRTDFVRVNKTELPHAEDRGSLAGRFRTVLTHPYFEDDRSIEELSRSTGLLREECHLHRGSDVISSNDRLLGSIVAFLVHEDRIHAMIVKSGLTGFHSSVVVPVDAIAEVLADMVMLSIDRHEFRKLPEWEIATETKAARNRKEQLDDLVASSWYTVRDVLFDLSSRGN